MKLRAGTRARPQSCRIRSMCGAMSAAWNPGDLTGLAATLLPAESLAAGLLWQNTAKTVPATADGDPVRVAVCPYTAVEFTAPSDAARPLLWEEGGGLWSLAFDGVDDRLPGPLVGLSELPITTFAAYLSTDVDGSMAGASNGPGQNAVLYKGGASTLAMLVQLSGNRLYRSVAATGSSWHVAEMDLTGTLASFSGTLYRGGTLVDGPSAGSGAMSLTSYRWIVGGVDSPLSGRVAAALFLSATPSPGDRTLATGYLVALHP